MEGDGLRWSDLCRRRRGLCVCWLDVFISDLGWWGCERSTLRDEVLVCMIRWCSKRSVSVLWIRMIGVIV